MLVRRMLSEMADSFQTKKSLGQHFLNSPVVPAWMCDAGQVQAGDHVLEIGPGTGALTRELLARGATVTALETDRRALEVLRQTFTDAEATGQLTLIDQDVRQLDLSGLDLKDGTFKVIANIPYYLTGHLFRVFLESPIQPSDLVFLVQKEVAKRATARLSRGEKESLLSLSIKAFGEPVYVRTVGKGHFSPSPKVDSAIILIRNINRDKFKDVDPAAFFKILHLGFGQKRKQLVGNLSHTFDRDLVEQICTELHIPLTARAEDIPLTQWLELTKRLGRHS